MSNIADRIARFTPEQRALFMARRKQIDARNQGETIPRRAGMGPWPASVDQTALWFFNRLEVNSSAYNIGNGMRLNGPLQVDFFEKALNEVVRRHEILRTRFHSIDGRPYQVIEPQLFVPVIFTDLKANENPEKVARQEVARFVTQPFDLERGPLIRVLMLETAVREHVLIVMLHHTVTDWWSYHLLFNELWLAYEAALMGNNSPLPELPIQYADYTEWRERWMESEDFQRQRQYWLQKMAGAPHAVALPTDKPRPAVQSYHGAREFFKLPRTTIEGLRLMNRSTNATSLMTLLSSVYVFLFRYCGQTDLVVGSPVTDRERDEVKPLIGYLINTLVFRADLSDDPDFYSLLARVKNIVLEALEHKDLPFRSLVEALNPPRDLSRMPVYQIEFLHVASESPIANLESIGKAALNKLSLEQTRFRTDRKTSPIDLQVTFIEGREDIDLILEFNTDIFVAETIKRMGNQLLRLFDNLYSHPQLPISQVPWLTDERDQLLQLACGPRPQAPVGDILSLMAQNAARNPNAIALRAEQMQMTYGEFWDLTSRLAAFLRKQGQGREKLVGIYLERDLDLVPALCAVLLCGAAFVPLDPSWPSDRLAYMMKDSGMSVILHGKSIPWETGSVQCLRLDSFRNEIQQQEPLELGPVEPEQLAYVLYTSGSTGLAKGVAIARGNLNRICAAFMNCHQVGPESSMLAVTTISFDISMTELLAPLTVGAKVILAPTPVVADGFRLLDLLAREEPSHMQGTPATWRMMLEAGWEQKRTLTAICGGEALSNSLASQLLDKLGRLGNFYGPTEATIWVCGYFLKDGQNPVHLGNPLAFCDLFVLDQNLELAPTGVPGELYIGGANLMRGYLGKPAVSARCLLPDPHGQTPGGRLYKTGDQVRRLTDGSLDFMGRLDHQIKLRGFRIECGEIESALRRHPAIKEAVVLLRQLGGQPHLVAWYQNEGPELNPEELKSFLKQSLPIYMVPNFFNQVTRWPQTPNGKLNRQALKDPEATSSRAYVAPRNPTEEWLVGLWKELLNLPKPGVHDNFFEMGGHSLLTTRLISRILDQKGVEVPLVQFFESPTIASVADFVARSTSQEDVDEDRESFEL